MFKTFTAPPQMQRLIILLMQLTSPPDEISDPRLRIRLRVTSSLLLFLAVSLALGLGLGWFRSNHLAIFASLIGSLSLYFLNRLGHFELASWGLMLVFSLVPKLSWLNTSGSPTGGSTDNLVSWTIVSSILSYFIFTLPRMIRMIIISETALIAVMLLANIPIVRFSSVLYFTVFVDILLLVAAAMRERSEKMIDLQAQSLEQERIRIHTLLEAAQEAIILHKEGKVMMVNPAFEKMFAYETSEVVGSDFLKLIHESDREKVTERYRQHEDGAYDVTALRKDGKTMALELSGKSQYVRGEHVRIVSMRDVTERRVEQQRNIELAVEQEKVRILQKFISDISHDLRTPLSVINTSIYLIEKLANNPQRQQAQIDVLQSQATQVQRLLEDLITMSRLDKADTSDFTFRHIDIHELLAKAVNEGQNDALRKKHTLIFQPTTKTPPKMFADPTQIKRMIRHLILNGLNYTPEGGEIVVSTVVEDPYVVISVRDNGPGIPADVLPYIFDQFYRGDSARGGEGGIGLGLTIARKIAKAHAGKIDVQSVVGEGSDFRIYLPAPAEAAR